MFTKFLSGLFALAFLALSSTADAGWNLRQNDDGTTDWVRDGTDTTQDAHPVGSVYLNVLLEDISTASTVAVVVPIDNAEVTLIQSAPAGDVTVAATIDFWVMRGITNESQLTAAFEVSDTVAKMVIAASTSRGTIDTFTPTTQNTVEKGTVILIHTAGNGAGGDIDTVLTITVAPR